GKKYLWPTSSTYLSKLRRSEILSSDSNFAPTELGSLIGCCYKHPAPTELNDRDGCGVLRATWQRCYLSNTIRKHHRLRQFPLRFSVSPVAKLDSAGICKSNTSGFSPIIATAKKSGT